MKAARLIYPLLGAVALVMSGAAHAETFGDVMQSWTGQMTDALDRFQGRARETQMKEITKNARDRLLKVSCKTEQDASRTINVVSVWTTTKNLPIEYTYTPTCNLKTQLLEGKFEITRVIPDSRQDAREDANNVIKLISVVATWGQAMRKAIDDIHEQNKLKEQIDAVTGTAIKAFAEVPCRRSSDVSVPEVVADVVAKQKLPIEYSASGQCDSAKHTWQVNLKVSKFTVAFDPKKDAADTNFSSGVLAGQIIDQLFADAKRFIAPEVFGSKLEQQVAAARRKIDDYWGRLNQIKCGATPTDKTAGYVQDLITTKARDSGKYLKVENVRVGCTSGHLNVVMTADPVPPAPMPTLGPITATPILQPPALLKPKP